MMINTPFYDAAFFYGYRIIISITLSRPKIKELRVLLRIE